MSSSNFHRLVAFLVNICTCVLKEFLIKCAKNDQCHNYTDLNTYMLDAKIVNAVHALKIVRRDQVKKLYPNPGVFDESALDVSLLVNLLLGLHENTIINGQAVIQGDVKKALNTIRNHRNVLQHKLKTTDVDDQEFDDMWKSLKLSSMTLAKTARGSTFEEEVKNKIDYLMVNCFPGLPDILTDWFMSIVGDLRSQIEDVQAACTDTNKTAIAIKERTDEIPEIKNMVQGLVADMSLMTRNVFGFCRNCLTRGYSSVKLSLVKSAKQLQVHGDTGLPVYHGLEFLPNDPDGRIAAIDCMNSKLVILSRDLQLIGNPYQFDAFVWGVSVISSNRLIVTAKNWFYILEVCKSSTVELVKTLKHNHGCWHSISALSPDTVTVANIYADPPIAMVTLTENTVNRVDVPDLQYAEQKYDKNVGFVTFVKETDSVAFTNYSNSTVHMYNRQDKTTFRIQDKRIVRPLGVCEGPGGSVFVCSGGTRSIVHISPKGQIIDSYRIDIDVPSDVAFSSVDSSLVVYNTIANEVGNISLYKIL